MIRFERHLDGAISRATEKDCPPKLASALRYAVFPGGARIRPRLTLAVAKACAVQDVKAALGAAAAIELMHCASLVHDDLPCFDDSDLRRGKPSVHRAYGEAIALLAGDALIVLAFEELAMSAQNPRRLAELVRVIGAAVGSSGGIVAGQAWESEPALDLVRYHQAKTGALFAGATMAGAVAADMDARPWAALGHRLGEAFQVADDIRDVASSEREIGKPCGQDVARNRPNIAHDLGLGGAIRRLDELIDTAVADIPECPGASDLRALIVMETRRFLPAGLARSAA